MAEEEFYPPDFKLEYGLVWGFRIPYLLEIKFHSPKNKNAITFET